MYQVCSKHSVGGIHSLVLVTLPVLRYIYTGLLKRPVFVGILPSVALLRTICNHVTVWYMRLEHGFVIPGKYVQARTLVPPCFSCPVFCFSPLFSQPPSFWQYAYVWKMTRLPLQDVDVHEPIHSSSMPTSTTSTTSTPDDWDDDEEDVFGEDGESAVVDEATCSPAATTPTTNRDDTAVPFPPRNEVLEGHETEQLVCDDLKGENEGEEENEVEKENGGEEEEKNEKDEKEDEEEKEGEESQEEQDGEVRRCEEHVVSPLCVYDVLLRGKVTSASGRPEVCPATDEAVMFDHFEPGTLLYTAEQEIGQSMSEDEEEEEGEKDNEDEDADKKEEEEDEDADKKDEEEGEKKEDEDAEKKDEKEKEGGGEGKEGGGEEEERGNGGEKEEEDEGHRFGKIKDAPLKVGDVLRGKLVSASRNSAVWPAADGALMFGRFVPSDKNEDVHIFDEHGEPREATGMAKVQVLLGVNGRQLRKAMSLRRRVEEEKGNGKGTEEGTEDAKGESFFGWLPWSGRAQRELQTARENAGQVDVSVNNKACIVSQWKFCYAAVHLYIVVGVELYL